MKIVQFGNPLLRARATKLSLAEIKSTETQALISDMRELLETKKLGVGLAAPQVGKSVALAIIEIQKTPLRDTVQPFSLVIINPRITECIGKKSQLWEGCISGGPGRATLFAKVPRYKKLKLTYFDQNGAEHEEIFDGLAAHIIQHEVDHLNGLLFVDKVKDTSTYTTYAEYKKRK